MKVNVSLDTVRYSKKPEGKDQIIAINNRIAGYAVTMELGEFVDKVGNQGYTFCPAVFFGGRRRG